MLKGILRAAVDAALMLRDELRRVRPVPAPATAPRRYEAPRDRCEVCGTEPTVDVREIRLERPRHRHFALRVCAEHARVAPTKVIADLEAAIDDGHVRVPNDEIYG